MHTKTFSEKILRQSSRDHQNELSVNQQLVIFMLINLWNLSNDISKLGQCIYFSFRYCASLDPDVGNSCTIHSKDTLCAIFP